MLQTALALYLLTAASVTSYFLARHSYRNGFSFISHFTGYTAVLVGGIFGFITGPYFFTAKILDYKISLN
jgi:hypothetical protein